MQVWRRRPHGTAPARHLPARAKGGCRCKTRAQVPVRLPIASGCRCGCLEEYPQYRHGTFGGFHAAAPPVAAVHRRRTGRHSRRPARSERWSRRLTSLHGARASLGFDSMPCGSPVEAHAVLYARRGRKFSTITSTSSIEPSRGVACELDQFEAVATWLRVRRPIPCSPVLSMKEIANDPSLRASGTVAEVDHKGAAST